MTMAMRCSCSLEIARCQVDSFVLVSALMALVVLCRDRKHDHPGLPGYWAGSFLTHVSGDRGWL